MIAAFLAVDVDDCAAAAVGDPEAVVVAGAEDAFADGELEPVASRSRSRPRRPCCVEDGAGDGVELGDVGSPIGDHHVPGEIIAGRLPPVGDKLRLRLGAVVGDDEPSLLGGVGEVVAASPVAEEGEGPAFELGRAGDGSQSTRLRRCVHDRWEKPAGADGGELGRVTDQHHLPRRARPRAAAG